MTATTISTSKPKVRQSNFELLRIIAMFMVLILHADFQALGAPDKAELIKFPLAATIKVIFEMACIVAVNVFVLISGWFGIRPSVKGISKFIFQCLFFSLGIYAVVLIKGDAVFSFRGLADCFAMMGGGYWFITSYLCLYIFSPVVNAFIETASKITYRNVLIAFFAFQTIYGFCSSGAQFIEKGYSAISFIGLYMLAGYIKRYVNPEWYSKQLGFWIYLATTTLLSMIYVGAKYYGVDSIASRCIVYSNPLVIISSVSLLIWFAKVRITSRFFNTIASSCFAVYLLHTNSNLYPFYLQGAREVVANYSIINFVNVVLYLFSWFILAIAIDRLRIVLYDLIFKKITWK
jgi:surface polysaccharide O-acyltransferase-like enzyme